MLMVMRPRWRAWSSAVQTDALVSLRGQLIAVTLASGARKRRLTRGESSLVASRAVESSASQHARKLRQDMAVVRQRSTRSSNV